MRVFDSFGDGVGCGGFDNCNSSTNGCKGGIRVRWGWVWVWVCSSKNSVIRDKEIETDSNGKKKRIKWIILMVM